MNCSLQIQRKWSEWGKSVYLIPFNEIFMTVKLVVIETSLQIFNEKIS